MLKFQAVSEKSTKKSQGLHFCRTLYISRICAVALNAVLEAIAQVNRRGENSHPYAAETRQPIWMLFQIHVYHYSAKGVDLQNSTKIDSTFPAVRMCDKNAFRWILFVHSLSIPFFVAHTSHVFQPAQCDTIRSN